MAELAGKVAVVTGASRGIGRAIAERLGRDGASVVVNYVNQIDQANAVVAAIEASGGRAIAVQADIGNVPDIRRLFQAAEDHFGGLDIVVNNAATALFKPTVDATEEDFERLFNIIARGTFFSLQETARRIRDGGRIVSISTIGTVLPGPGASLYLGSKAAVEQFNKVLSKELGSRNVTVNIVSPGLTRTDGLIMPQAAIDQGVAMTPLGRLGEPDDVASVVGFLVGSDGRWVTGQNILAGGGIA